MDLFKHNIGAYGPFEKILLDPLAKAPSRS